jgi:uncharacterized protein
MNSRTKLEATKSRSVLVIGARVPHVKWRRCARELLAVACIAVVLCKVMPAAAGPADTLVNAAIRGDAAAVQGLLEKDEKDGGSALLMASLKGHLEVVRVLLAAGVDVNTKDSNGTTALILAAWKRHLGVVQALIDKGVDVNARAKDGNTALMLASSEGELKIVQALLAAGANVNAKQSNGATALILACNGYTTLLTRPEHEVPVALDEGNLAVVQALLAKGADVDVSRSDGYTALMVAVSQAGSVKMVQALIDKGADVNAKANDSATALTLASKNSHLDVAQLLRTAGAK